MGSVVRNNNIFYWGSKGRDNYVCVITYNITTVNDFYTYLLCVCVMYVQACGGQNKMYRSFSLNNWVLGIKSRSSGLADQSCCSFHISTSDEWLEMKVLMVSAAVMGLDTILRSFYVLIQFPLLQDGFSCWGWTQVLRIPSKCCSTELHCQPEKICFSGGVSCYIFQAGFEFSTR